MVRIFQTPDKYQDSQLVLDQESNTNRVEIFYIPSKQKLEESYESPDEAASYRTKLLSIDMMNKNITIFPINTIAGHKKFLKPKYQQIERITLAQAQLVITQMDHMNSSGHKYTKSLTLGPTVPIYEDIKEDQIAPLSVTLDEVLEILEDLPRGFTKNYEFGLGLAKPYRFIVTAIETLSNADEIVISQDHETEVDEANEIFYISTDDFETLRKSLDSTHRLSLAASKSVRETESHNFFANKIGKSTIPISMGRHRYRKLFTLEIQSGDRPLSDNDQNKFLDVISKNVKTIIETNPQKLSSLKNDIDLVNLESLIREYELMMSRKHSERDWQMFLNKNPFILGLAFGYPIIKIQDQASIGSRSLSGSGDTIADFLVKNSLTNNTAIIEIKTPQSKLLNHHSFRNRVFTPSSLLSGSINQALDQKYHFERQIIQLKDSSKMYDIQSYSVHCCLIIGTVPKDEHRLKSFEIFRGNSSDVEIITFDELLHKLKNLYAFLEIDDTEDSGNIEVNSERKRGEDTIPF